MRRLLVCSAFAACLLAATSDAHADADSARHHFEAGKKLRDDSDCQRAIPEFEKSIAAEKSIGAFYNLGYCHEQLGHRQEAYDAYKQAQQLASTKKDDRYREISGAIAALMETPHVRLILPQPIPDGLSIKVDDQLVPSSIYQTETIIFTKANKYHMVVVTAPGYEERRENVETKQLKQIQLSRASAAPLEGSGTASAPSSSSGGLGWTWRHWAGLGVAAVGAGIFVVQSVNGIRYYNTYSDEEKQLFAAFNNACSVDGIAGCNETEHAEKTRAKGAYEAHEDEAKDKRGVYIGTIIGAALLTAGGVILFVTAPTAHPSSPTTGSTRLLPTFDGSRAGLSLSGSF